MVEIKRDYEIEYENNAGKLRQLRNENLINDANYRTVNCFFEYNLNEKICSHQGINCEKLFIKI